MNTFHIYYPSGKQIELRGTFGPIVDIRDFAMAVDPGASAPLVVIDPRCVVTDVDGNLLYNGRDFMDNPRFAPELRAWLVDHPTWPPATLPAWHGRDRLGFQVSVPDTRS